MPCIILFDEQHREPLLSLSSHFNAQCGTQQTLQELAASYLLTPSEICGILPLTLNHLRFFFFSLWCTIFWLSGMSSKKLLKHSAITLLINSPLKRELHSFIVQSSRNWNFLLSLGFSLWTTCSPIKQQTAQVSLGGFLLTIKHKLTSFPNGRTPAAVKIL